MATPAHFDLEGEEIDVATLKKLSPLDGMKSTSLETLAKKTSIQTVSGGRYLFKEGDSTKLTVYVLSGEIELRAGDKVVRVIEGGSSEARMPIAPLLPRKLSARARNRVRFLAIDSDMLDVILTWDQTGSYDVSELRGNQADSDDWMTALLKTPAFHKIPPANIQAIFARMETVRYKTGDAVITQGEEGDYYYVLTAGRAEVTRETPLKKEGIKLADVKVGDTFGEEALISGAKRNATVTMVSDGAVQRLSKEDFHSLLNEPMLEWLYEDDAQKVIDDGGKWLDVRLPSEYKEDHKERAANIPLYCIRLKMRALRKDRKYVVYCDTGRRSSAAAYILGKFGYDAYVLKRA